MRSHEAPGRYEGSLDRRIRATALAMRLSSERLDYLLSLSIDDKQRYLQRRARMTFALLIALCAAAFVLSLIYRAHFRAPAAPRFRDAGTVLSVELHSSFLNTSSTVVTSSATLQVQGAVSAAQGDIAQMRTDISPTGDMTSLCIVSDIKPACYRLL